MLTLLPLSPIYKIKTILMCLQYVWQAEWGTGSVDTRNDTVPKEPSKTQSSGLIAAAA